MRLIPTHQTRAAMISAVLVLGFGCVGTPKNPTTPQEVEAKVRIGVPLGSTRSEVETWLKSQGIESHYEDKPRVGSVVEQSGLEPEEIGGLLTVLISDTSRSFLVTMHIQIHFFFDQNGKTIKHEVKSVGTGP